MEFRKIFGLFLVMLLVASSAFAGDIEIFSNGTKQKTAVHKLDTAGGITVSVSGGKATFTAQLRTATDAVASGQTSKAVTVSGVTTASNCVASLNEATTNAVYVRGVVPTADTVTVTLSGDPGASNADLSVICVEP